MPAIVDLQKLASMESNFAAIILMQRIGDIIACEPVIGYAKKQWPNLPLVWVTFAKHVELLESHPGLDYIAVADNLVEATNWSQTLPEGCRVINLHHHRQPCPLTRKIVFNSNDPAITFFNYYDYGSLLEAFSRAAGLPPLTEAPHFYASCGVSLPDIPKPYVVFQCLSSDTNRDWDEDKWQTLFSFFADQKISVAEVGLKPVLQAASPFYHDLTGVNTLQGVAGIIKGASFFVGIDSGFAHMANASGVEGVIIMGVFNQWHAHVPFTGKYSRGRIVRHPSLPARYVPVKKVIERYQALVSGLEIPDDRQPPPIKSPTEARPGLKFPNTAQRLVLKCYRPFVKWFAESHEYNLFKANPRLFFIRPGRLKPAVRPMRRLLRILGPVPPQVNEYME